MSVASDLATLGWRTDTSARLAMSIRDFQRGFSIGPALTVDGAAGPKTKAAIATSINRRRAGLPDASEHFSFRDFRCLCSPVAADCRRIWVAREVIRFAEAYRSIVGPFTPVRACRCARYNAHVGGAKNSMHLHGLALDLPVFNVTPKQIRALRLVSGIGYYKSSVGQVVRHVDLRHLRSDDNGDVATPATWLYGAWTKPVPDPIPPRPDPKPPTDPEEIDMTPDELKAVVREAVREEVDAAFADPKRWRRIFTGADFRFFKNRLAKDPATAERIPLGQAIENATEVHQS